jgi:hypothetical protein
MASLRLAKAVKICADTHSTVQGNRWLGEIDTSRPDMARSASFARGYLCAVREEDLAGAAARRGLIIRGQVDG